MDNIIRGNYIALRRIAGKHPSHRTPHEVALLRTLIVELADDVPDDAKILSTENVFFDTTWGYMYDIAEDLSWVS